MKKTLIISVIVAICSVTYSNEPIITDFLSEKYGFSFYDSTGAVYSDNEEEPQIDHCDSDKKDVYFTSNYITANGKSLPAYIYFHYLPETDYIYKVAVRLMPPISKEGYQLVLEDMHKKLDYIFDHNINRNPKYSELNPFEAYDLVKNGEYDFIYYSITNGESLNLKSYNTGREMTLELSYLNVNIL